MKPTLLTVIFLFSAGILSAQLKVNNGASSMEIDGTSNVHDWTEKVETITGSCSATLAGTKLSDLKAMDVTIPVRAIKSGKSTMDKNTYNAMNADKHPNIYFNLKSASISGNKVLCTGTLTINGKTNSVTITCTYAVSGGKLTLKGDYKMKMTQYGIEPPTAMLGAMTTGDDLTIRFNLVFN